MNDTQLESPSTRVDSTSHYHEHGYMVVRSLFSEPELEALRQDVVRLQAEGRLANLLVHTPSNDSTARAEGAEPPGRVNLQLCPASPVSDLIHAMRGHPGLLGTVRELLGDPVRFLLDQIFIKPGLSGAGTDWHQDHAYFAGKDAALGVGMWTSLQDATIENGTMRVIPGSHRQAVNHARDPRSDSLIHAQVDESRAIAIELRAGDALFFNFGLLHCTRDNRSQHSRCAVALHFVHDSYEPPPHWTLATTLTGPGARVEVARSSWLAMTHPRT